MDEEPATSDVIIDKAMWHSDARQDKEDLLKGGPASSGKGGERLWQWSCENNFFAWMKAPYTFLPNYPTLLIFKIASRLL